MEALKSIDHQINEERILYDGIFDLLGYDKITFNGKLLCIHFNQSNISTIPEYIFLF